MLPTLIIVFREVIEAGLIIGIVMAATQGVKMRGRYIGFGISGGVLGACLVAAFAGTIANLMDGVGQEVFNVAVLTVAVIMLAWHNIWMAREGRKIAQDMKSLGNDVAHGRRSVIALPIVVGIAVLREGSEIVLFLYGIALSGGSSTFSMILGGALGLLLGAGVSAVMYVGLVRIPTRLMFAVTSWLIALLAAGMASQAVAFLQQAGLVTSLSHAVWNTSWLLANDSVLGKTLHVLVGYTERPTGMQLVAYAGVLTVIVTLTKLFGQAEAGLPKETRAVLAGDDSTANGSL